MNLAQFPRRHYTQEYTPIEKLNNLSETLGGPNIYIKRDDLLGLTAGGNKTRKLEFLVADALAQGCDTLITCGGIQSNHCRLTLAAAVKERLSCHLILKEVVENSYDPQDNGNIFLYNLLGADAVKVFPKDANLNELMVEEAQRVKARGGKPYIIPMGGSNTLGTLGYIACAREILAQAFQQGVNFKHVICPSGSGATQAGLIIGLENTNIEVMGINVMSDTASQKKLVGTLINSTINEFDLTINISTTDINCTDKYVGPGYTLPTAEMGEAVKLLATTEGILLDPVYTGKAMAGLIDLVRQGYFRKDENVVFIHTGGAPALYANTGLFTAPI